eukprot:3180360-Pyramimonas_sp.AAC.1
MCIRDRSCPAATIDDIVKQIAPKINATIGRFEDLENGPTSAIKTTSDNIINELMSCNLAYKLRIPNDQLGVHPQNRFTMGVEAFD